MYSIVAQSCKQCGTCAPTKDISQYAPVELQPLLVSPVQFHSYNFDFVTNLAPAQGFDFILLFIDYLTKLMHLIPCIIGKDELSAAKVTKVLFKNIVRFYRVPKELVYKYDPRFTAQLWHK